MSHPHGLLQVTIDEARNLKDKDIVGKDNTYVEVYLDKHYKQRTRTIRNTNNPNWNEVFTLLANFSLFFFCI